ncbi:hypothetical protein TrVFT333_007212 [Trichoderma virens FT-333]|nr:hypothetical protein TrVFT333_007212 [Trichoderma virens FT-333]
MGTPGGSIDPSDPSVLSAAARELYEESRLSNAHFHTWVAMARDLNLEDASRMKNWGIQPEDEKATDIEVRIGQGQEGDVVRVTTFLETSNVWGKINFVATAEGQVVIDPEEHVEWGWFTEEEVRRGRAAAPFDNGDGSGIGEEKKEEEEERVLEFTSRAVWGSVLESFRVGRELGVIV